MTAPAKKRKPSIRKPPFGSMDRCRGCDERNSSDGFTACRVCARYYFDRYRREK